MTGKKLRIGIIGCGMVAYVGHAPVYHKSPYADIVAVADPLESHRKKFQRKFKVSKLYENSDDLLDNTNIDAVSICSPHWAHVEQVIRAAENGKDVLCEKPIGIDLEDVDRMIKAVEKNCVIFQTATQKRFDPGFQYIKEGIMNNEIGDIFQASVFWYHGMPDFGDNLRKELIQEIGLWRLSDKRCGGGDLLDHGPHYFDLYRWWFGDVKTVSAEIRRIHQSRVNEDHSLVTLSFKDNEKTAIFERSEAIFGDVYGEEMGRIHGTEGSYFFNVPSEYKKKPMSLKKHHRVNVTSKPTIENIKFPHDKWGHAYSREVRSFINQALDRPNDDVGFPKKWIPTIYDGRAALEIVLAAYESQRTNDKITLPLKKYKKIDWNCI
ncbi:MAG: hypothetical protein GF317_09230 [Candidatus Lokiarchaeota archaeon]|nr:hypothetical protein [Candidatus Lokiarchaeota archaeon]MBD3199893.1 hypothetical protein [Candidatus Lokiarchaeota archaeon]